MTLKNPNNPKKVIGNEFDDGPKPPMFHIHKHKTMTDNILRQGFFSSSTFTIQTLVLPVGLLELGGMHVNFYRVISC